MSQLVFQSTSGGQVNLIGPATSSTFNINVPATSGNMVTTGDTGTVTTTMLASTTGSGAVVLATSPTLVTPALGTPSALIGTNITGTAAGLSIGGNAATATTATNQSGGTTSATSIAYSTTLTGGTGIVNLGSGQFYKDASGNVGIGTSSPAAKLNVVDSGTGANTALIQSGQTGTTPRSNTILRVQATATGRDANIQLSDNVTNSAEIGMVGGPMYFATGGSEKMRIDTSGNVGIGTSSPAAKLNVIGDFQLSRSATASDVAINFGNNSNNYIYGGNGSNLMAFATNGAERMRIDSSGNLLVGTTSGTSAKLYVSQDQAAYSYFDFSNSTNGGGIVWRQIHRNIANTTTSSVDLAWLTGGGFAVNNNDTGAANFTSFGIGGTEAMRIDSSRNVLIGKTSPTYTTSGVSLSSGTSQFAWSTNSGSVVASFATPVSQNQLGFYRSDTGAVMGTIANGASNTVSYNTSSDYRLKENVQPMTGALEKVSLLRPVTWTWKGEQEHGEGFIAHEVQAIVPCAVTGEKDAVDENGQPKYQGIDTGFLVATLTAAIKEQQTLIESLTTRLEILESK